LTFVGKKRLFSKLFQNYRKEPGQFLYLSLWHVSLKKKLIMQLQSIPIIKLN